MEKNIYINKNQDKEEYLSGLISFKNIQEAEKNISKYIVNIPTVPLNYNYNYNYNLQEINQNQKVYLQLENLHTIGSYKIRGALNVLSKLISVPSKLDYIKKYGIVTASAGNFSQGIAQALNIFKINCQFIIIVPNHASQTKLDAVKRIYANTIIIKLSSRKEWFDIVSSSKVDYKSLDYADKNESLNSLNLDDKNKPYYISPTSNNDVIEGNGSIGIELFNNVKNLDCVLVPYGGGGLIIGITTALKNLNPNIKVFACEVDTASPLIRSLESNKPININSKPSFVDGMGGSSVIPENFDKVKKLIDGCFVVTLQDIADSVKILAERHRIIVEGAGAGSLACYLKFRNELKEFKNIACIVSGGNINNDYFIKILNGSYPKF